jgi:hypothetical protein
VAAAAAKACAQQKPKIRQPEVPGVWNPELLEVFSRNRLLYHSAAVVSTVLRVDPPWIQRFGGAKQIKQEFCTGFVDSKQIEGCYTNISSFPGCAFPFRALLGIPSFGLKGGVRSF